MKKFSFAALFSNLVVCLFVAAIAVPALGEAGYIIPAAMFVCGFVRSELPQGVLRVEVIRTLFTSDLQKKLYPVNEFYNGAQSDAAAVEVETIEIPQDEDGDAQVVVNPTQFPLETYTEEDKKKSYGADLVATKPQLVTDLNQALVSYDKRSAKLQKHVDTLNNTVAERIMNAWGPTKAEFIRQTTGAGTRAATAPGATGTRKIVTQDDMQAMFTLFNKLNIPMDGRRALFPPDMYEDLLKIPGFVDADKLGKMGVVPDGVIGSIYNFMIYMRSSTLVYTEAALPVKRAIGGLTAATDNLSALFWHPRFVRYIKGTAKVYINPDQGQYLGGTLNAALRAGGTITRLSEIGVAALVQDN